MTSPEPWSMKHLQQSELLGESRFESRSAKTDYAYALKVDNGGARENVRYDEQPRLLIQGRLKEPPDSSELLGHFFFYYINTFFPPTHLGHSHHYCYYCLLWPYYFF